MAEQKRSRAALLGARTRARNVSLHGAGSRLSAREANAKRITKGRATVSSAYGGTPSRADFLKQAHLFERIEGSKKKDRAFMVPGGLDVLRREEEIVLFWYRRNSAIELPSLHDTLVVNTKEGDVYRLVALEQSESSWKTNLGGQSLLRSCTGAARFYVT
jgi:hypothetical protein